MIRVISGKAKGKKLLVPGDSDESGGITRPVTDRARATLFDLIQDFIPGAKILDLFAGSGALGIEALSRGAISGVFVDSADEATKVIKHNLLDSGLNKGSGTSAQVITSNIPQSLHKLFNESTQTFDIVFCDPPFADFSRFKLNDYSCVINTENLFVLRAPSDFMLKPEENLGYDFLYTKKVGNSLFYFIRKIKR